VIDPDGELSAANGSPQVSVCIPTYNSSAFVAETIESVLAQDHPSFELVIADHGSTDSTEQIIRRYADDARVRVVVGEPGGGAQANWNRATDLARGDYVKLVCADDPLYVDCLSRQAAVLDENPDVVLVASPRDIVDAQGRIVFRRRGLGGLTGRVAGPDAVRRSVQLGTNIFGEPSSVLMRASAVRSAGPWSDALPYLIDQDMYVRVLQHGDFFAIPDSLATFRLSTTSWSLALARQQAVQARAFHKIVSSAYPGLISSADHVLGGLRAEGNAWARRLVYLMLRRRLQVPVTSHADADSLPR
jgi:glycosyltransferase involved in cell wall biosynthesis